MKSKIAKVLEKLMVGDCWCEAGIGNPMYAGRHSEGCIMARSLLQEETATANEGKEVDGNTSDGYHTFNELYDHRIALYLVLVNLMPDKFWKSKKHEDGSAFEGWFILGGNIGTGDISYHLPISKWDEAKCQDIPLGKKWDGHTAADVVERLSRHRPPTEAKPTANVSLVEELRKVQKEVYALKLKERDGLADPENQLSERYKLGISAGLGIASDKMLEILSRYESEKPTAPASLVDELRIWEKRWPHATIGGKGDFNEILSHYTPVQEQEPLAGLREALEKLARLGNGTEYGNSDGNRIAQEALAKYPTAPTCHPVKQEEPLAVLADRKGYGVHVYRYDQMGDVYVSLSKGHRNNWVERWNAPTYAEAEAKARRYLETLNDKKEGR